MKTGGRGRAALAAVALALVALARAAGSGAALPPGASADAAGASPGAGTAGPGGATGGPGARLPAVEAARVAAWAERRATAAAAGAGVRAESRGADPVRVVALSDARRVVVLSGASRLLLTDAALRQLDAADGPPGCGAVAVLSADELLVGGEASGRIARFAVRGDRLVAQGELALPGVVSVRDLAFSRATGRAYALDRFDRQLVDFSPTEPGQARRRALPAGADRIQVCGDRLVINCVLAHQVLVLSPGDGRVTTLAHAGPTWSAAAAPVGDRLRVAIGGLEELPLDRSAGEFDHMDSALHVHEIARDGTVITRESVNLSAVGVVTPRALAFDPADPGTVWVAGAGARAVARVAVGATPRVQEVLPIGPGVVDLAVRRDGARVWIEAASPLADAVWALEPGRGVVETLATAPGADPAVRLGEYLVLTDMMSPHNVSDGPRSRLSCEACHFEGDGDGRIHFSGRGAVRVTPKSIRGLVDNVPLFSRAGDPSLATMTMGEFRVANQHRRVLFDVDAAAWPGLGRTGAIGPAEQREGFLSFLAEYRHRPNPAAGTGPIGEQVRRGLAVFRERCVDCHQARASTREPAAFVPFARWVDALQGRAPELVWGSSAMYKTGIEPYPSPKGTRVPSLRRVWMKWPYFTNGSSLSLAAALARFRWRGARSWHHHDPREDAGEPPPAALAPADVEALVAALRLF